MSSSQESVGSCLCGAVSFSTNSAVQSIGACHCTMCRKWGGGPYMEVNCGADVLFHGTENIRVYDSSDWAERGFCKNCGSHLFYRLKANHHHAIPVGLFDDDAGLVFDHQVFIDEKPGYYSFANKTLESTGDELFAKFNGDS